MNVLQQKKFLANLTRQQKEIIHHYHDNNMEELKKICDPLIFLKGVPRMNWDDLYDVASDTLLESLKTYDSSKGSQFRTYLSQSIKKAYYDWTRDKRRFKRCNLTEERDENGDFVKDKHGKQKYIVVADISIDAPIGDDSELTLKDMLPSGFDLEIELADEIGISSDIKIDKYLEKLSKKQRQVVMDLSDGYSPSEIRERLHMTEKEYADCMMAIRAYRNIKILL